MIIISDPLSGSNVTGSHLSIHMADEIMIIFTFYYLKQPLTSGTSTY